QTFAERLGDWLDVADAIALSATLNARPASLAGPQAGESSSLKAAIEGEFARVRSALVDAMTTDGVSKSGKGRIKWPTPTPGAPPEVVADFSPYHRYYQAHQREMEANIDVLHAHVRAAL